MMAAAEEFEFFIRKIKSGVPVELWYDSTEDYNTLFIGNDDKESKQKTGIIGYSQEVIPVINRLLQDIKNLESVIEKGKKQ